MGNIFLPHSFILIFFTQTSPSPPSNPLSPSNPSSPDTHPSQSSSNPPNFGRILRSNDGTFSMESTIDTYSVHSAHSIHSAHSVHFVSNNNSLVSSFMTIPFQLVESKLKKVFEDAVANNLYFIRS